MGLLPGNFGRRLQLARKTALGLFSERAAVEAHGLLAGLYPATGPVPERGTKELLDGYSSMPWLRAVANKVGTSVAATQWQLFKPAGGAKRDRIVQRAFPVNERNALIDKALASGRLLPVESHIFLDAIASANSFLVGHSLFLLTQVYMDLIGEAFWIKERNALGAPVGFWPVPPNWVRETPTVSHRYFSVAWAGWRGEIPDTEIVWFVDPNPSNPYGRGSGLARSLADELEADEYAARHVKMTMLNRARPDLIIWPEETRHDAGSISDDNARRLGEKWRAEHQGFWRAALPYFATRKLGVHELSQNFQELQLIELRRYERDAIVQCWGMPPEELGIIENSNRATIESADYIFKKNLIVPRLDLLRAYLQERVLPEYDERLVLSYVSPVQDDKEFQLKVATVAPWSLNVDEWRKMAGHEPLPDGGAAHMVPTTLQPRPTLDYDPPLTVPLGMPGAPGGTTVLAREPELELALRACAEAGDADGSRIIQRALADDPDDLPDLSRRVGKQEPAVRRQIAATFAALRDGTVLADLVEAVGMENAVEAVVAVVPIDAWSARAESDAVAYGAEAFTTGAKVGGEQAGLATRAPHPVFNRVNQEAVAWARARAAESIADLSAATLDGIRAAVVAALKQGWHPEKLARVIRESLSLTAPQSAAVVSFATRLSEADLHLSDERFWGRVGRYAEAQRRVRSLVIARTELAKAAGAGQQRLWDLAVSQGLLNKDRLRKRWIATYDERLEPICEGLADEEVGIDEPFSNGLVAPPAHPNCRCASGLIKADGGEASANAPATSLADAVEKGMQPLRDLVATLSVVRDPVVNVTVPAPVVHVHAPASRKIIRDANGIATGFE